MTTPLVIWTTATSNQILLLALIGHKSCLLHTLFVRLFKRRIGVVHIVQSTHVYRLGRTNHSFQFSAKVGGPG